MSAVMTERDAFYAELTSRNGALIGPAAQACLRSTRFVIAGCGSTGGSVVRPLVRSGATRFLLFEPGTFELTNLNRQDASVADVGRNKAEVARGGILAVNPGAEVEIVTTGYAASEDGRLEAGDLVLDAIDVTTDAGIAAKLALHAAACRKHLIVVTAYDIAFTQFLELFDYRQLRRPLAGRVRGTASDDVLRALIPASVIPPEIVPELRRRRQDPERPFPQLCATSTLLGALFIPYVLCLLTGRPVRRRLHIDLLSVVQPHTTTVRRRAAGVGPLLSLWRESRG